MTKRSIRLTVSQLGRSSYVILSYMALSWNEIKSRALEFSQEWAGEASEYPIAQSIVHYAKKQNLTFSKAQNVKAIPGKGLQGVVNGKDYWAGNRKMLESKHITLNTADAEKLARLEAEGKTILLFS